MCEYKNLLSINKSYNKNIFKGKLLQFSLQNDETLF